MGNAKSIQYLEVSAPSRPGEWVLQQKLPYCTIFRNKDTNYLAEQYLVMKDPKLSLLRTFEIYDYRRNQNHNLVEVYQAEQEPASYICQGVEYLRVKTQRIPYRLSELSNLSLSEGLFVMFNSLIGYRTIFEFNGPSIIDDDMIGFTQQGKVKVWISSNFAKNSSDADTTLQNSEGKNNQKLMITQVYDIVKDHLEDNQYPGDFIKLYQQMNPQIFASTLQFIEDYVRHANIVLPQSINYRKNESRNSVKSIQANILNNKRGQSHINTNVSPTKQSFIPCGFIPSSVNMRSPQHSKSQIQGPQVSNSQIKQELVTETNQHNIVEQVGNKPTIQSLASFQSQTGMKVQPSTFTFHQIKKNSFAEHQSSMKENMMSSRQQGLSFQRVASPPKTYILRDSKSAQNLHRYPSPIQSPTKVYQANQNFQQQYVRHTHLQQSPSQQRIFQQRIIPNGRQIRTGQNFHSNDKKMTEIYVSRNRSPEANSQPIAATVRSMKGQSVSRNTLTSRTPIKHNSIIHKLNGLNRIDGPQNVYGVYPNQLRSPQKQILQNKFFPQNKFQNNEPHKVSLLSPLHNTKTQQRPSKIEPYPCTTQVDSVRPQIRKLMIKTTQQPLPQILSSFQPMKQVYKQPSSTSYSLLEQKQSSQKSNLVEIKELEIRNYLIGHSHISPIKGLQDNKYINNIQTIKQKPNEYFTTTINQISCQQGTFKSFDRVMDSLNQSLMRVQTPISQIKRSQEKRESNQTDNTIKIGQFRNACIQEQEVDMSDIETIVQKNSSLIQNHILNEVEELDCTPQKQSAVPSYQQLRFAIISSKYRGDSYSLKSD